MPHAARLAHVPVLSARGSRRPPRCISRGRGMNSSGTVPGRRFQSTRSPPPRRPHPPRKAPPADRGPTRSRSWREPPEGNSPRGGRWRACREGRASADRPAAARLRRLCSGQGPQRWWAMGRQGLHEEPTFRARDRALRRDRAATQQLVAARRGTTADESLLAHGHHRDFCSPASSRSAGMLQPSCGPPGACGRRLWWGTVSARWQPHTSPECSA